MSSGSPTSSGATITWVTDEESSSIVDYGLTNSYGSTTSEADTSPRVTDHSVSLSGLVACTTYHYRVRSKDAANNEIIGSDNIFSTAGCTGSANITSRTSSSATIASGGSINLLSAGKGISLSIPASFASADANFQIKQLETTSVTNVTSTPANFSLVGSYLYDLKALTDISTSVTNFDNAITVTMTFGDVDIANLDESTLKIYRYNGSSWNQLNGCTVNTLSNSITCTTTAFSVFGLFGQEGNSSQTSNTTSTNNSTAVTCSASKPRSAPWLYGAIAQDSNRILLYFTPSDTPVTKYVLTYGTKSGEYMFGVEDLGVNDRNQMTFMVNSLSPNTTYYFKIRAQNNCATGDWSNELSTTTKRVISLNNLKITQSAFEPAIEQSPSSACHTYTVKSGESLWTIARDVLGDSNKYEEIIVQNKQTYPSLSSSYNLDIGWELKLNCGEKVANDEAQIESQAGYSVQVKVVDTKKQPVEGAKVTIHSKVQEAITDKEGVARFENVEAGSHRILIAYDNFEGEQSINLAGNAKEFTLNVTVQQKPFSLSLLACVIIGVLVLIIIILILIVRKKHNIVPANRLT